ncbi:hypothetical protein [Absidia glauca]|uniref:Major facilitator superfamily (MFS) profile domain-containing protein n=1 Tax=Absidia glauca TaxID=4829 RepID=A0A163JMN5_ABSGL|nr:hypothetical protein [Absidia glauca]
MRATKINEKRDASVLTDDHSFSSSESHYESTEEHVIRGRDPIVEKRLLRKLDMCLVPFVSIMFLFASLDRTNIGNAKLGSFENDLALQGNDFHLALMVFYIGYLACQIPSNLALKLTTPSLWIGFTTIIWHCSDSQSIWSDSRFVLGCAEAGLGPCVPLLLSFWYQRHELASRMSIFMSASSLAGCFGGIWAYLIMDHLDQVQGLASWRCPETASERWLAPDEKQMAIQRGVDEGRNSGDDTVEWQQVYGALMDYNTWIVALINGGAVFCHTSFSIFLPTVVRSMGFEALQAQLLSVPPYVIGCISLLVTCRISDRIRQRALLIMGCSVLTMIGYTFLLIGSNVGLQYTGVILVACGNSPAITLGVAWLSNNQRGHTRRGVSLSSCNMVAQGFALLSTQVYRAEDAPYYRLGHGLCLGSAFVALTLACVLRYLLVRENNRRDKQIGGTSTYSGHNESSETNQSRLML